jgi:hypothetical protein
MNQDEQLDRLERALQLFLKRPVRNRREARVTASKLEAYMTALREYTVQSSSWRRSLTIQKQSPLSSKHRNP